MYNTVRKTQMNWQQQYNVSEIWFQANCPGKRTLQVGQEQMETHLLQVSHDSPELALL